MQKPISIDINSKASDVLSSLMKNKISRLVITEKGEPTKIITEKDIGLFLLKEDSNLPLSELSVANLTKDLISVGKNTSLEDVAREMMQRGIGSLGVSSEEGLVGIITKSDLVRYYGESCVGKRMVGEFMSPFYAWDYDDSSLSKIVDKMISNRISRVVIRNHDESPVGIITFRDLFNISISLGRNKDVIDNSDPLISVIFPRKGLVSETGFGGVTKAKEVMTKNIVSVNYDSDLAIAGNLLLENKINGAGVLSNNETLIGIISKTDIVKALAFTR